jgi:hypothetical protein
VWLFGFLIAGGIDLLYTPNNTVKPLPVLHQSTMTARLRLLYGSAFVGTSDPATVCIDQMQSVANRAGHSFIAGVIGRWRVGQALYFVPGSRATIKKRIRTHAAPHKGRRTQFTTTDVYLGRFYAQSPLPAAALVAMRREAEEDRGR